MFTSRRIRHSFLALVYLLSTLSTPALAADTPPPTLVVIPGTLQKILGCPGDWQPECEKTALVYDQANDIWTATFTIPAGKYEYKVALNGSWAENYGLEAKRDGSNLPLVLAADTAVTFTYDHKTHAVTDSLSASGEAPQFIQPDMVVIPGTHQSELGCASDWEPDCDKAALTYDEEDGVWQGAFEIQPANDQDNTGPRYKVALNGGWAENYGAQGRAGGSDIPLVVPAPTLVKFYYNPQTHWVADNFNTAIVVAVGNFQKLLGCQNDDDATCLRAWLQDPDGDGIFAFTTTTLPPGDYAVAVALNESDTETFAAQTFTVTPESTEIYMAYTPATQQLLVSTTGAPKGNLSVAKAHWLTRDTLVWKFPKDDGAQFFLHFASEGGLQLGPDGVTGGETFLLGSLGGFKFTLAQKYPHLREYTPLTLADTARVPEFLKGQVALSVKDKDGKILDATSVQIPGVLDDLYTYAGPLGIAYSGDVPTLRLWGPTARAVTVQLYRDAASPAGTAVPLALDSATGVWSVTGAPEWTNQFYLYEVEVYVPATGQVEKNLVTDPYSIGLAMNSTRSQIVNLDDPALKPAAWDTLAKPALAAPEDAVIYELHVRDFSASDDSVPANARGTFKAFTELNSNGMKHLASLAQAGLTHIHLLPAFDIATIEEDKTKWQIPGDSELGALASDSDQQQELISASRDSDPFNWGYDPYHYTTPEGSYATDPNGSARTLEFRAMVQALNQTGLRVVMDVVYNHTNASGQSEKSVLDKVVPGYYHRLNADGFVENSTCCQNTATEHAMMEKLMIDSLVIWAKYYKVDGFRFDLMGHHMLSNLVNVRAALDALTLEKDGVDGKSIYVYGEGWDFGEVAKNARGQNAVQLNIAGTGLGVFNDRLRDAARGGGPFGNPQEQGFLTGLSDDPNDYPQGSARERETKLFQYQDWLRVGLAGNLKDYEFDAMSGAFTRGDKIDYNGSPAGYTADPQENIVYISAHDNETLFDVIQMKAPASATLADRVRMNNLGVSLVMLAQGVPFFHAGDDLLRSKSLDRNSYNSGDWFNKLDFTYQSNNWGVGLPAEGKDYWGLMRPLLADPALKPAPADIQFAAAHFRELLQIRQSSPLFRLRTADDVIAHLTFLNTGPQQIPGLIVMRLTDPNGDLDLYYSQIVVLFNANQNSLTYAHDTFKGLALELHPVQAASMDALVRQSQFDSTSGAFTIPARTAAVFVVKTGKPAPTPASAATAVPAPTAAPTVTPPPATAAPVSVISVPTVAPANLISLVAVVLAGLLGLATFLLRRRT